MSALQGMAEMPHQSALDAVLAVALLIKRMLAIHSACSAQWVQAFLTVLPMPLTPMTARAPSALHIMWNPTSVNATLDMVGMPRTSILDAVHVAPVPSRAQLEMHSALLVPLDHPLEGA